MYLQRHKTHFEKCFLWEVIYHNVFSVRQITARASILYDYTHKFRFFLGILVLKLYVIRISKRDFCDIWCVFFFFTLGIQKYFMLFAWKIIKCRQLTEFEKYLFWKVIYCNVFSVGQITSLVSIWFYYIRKFWLIYV